MKAQCPTCGQWLELPGRAATCPNCGSLVTIAVSAPPPGTRIFKEERGAKYERAPHYEPPGDEGMPSWLKSLIGLGIAAIVIFAVVFFGIWKVMNKLNAPVATTAPVVAPPPKPAPGPNSGSKLFSFDGTSQTAPQPPAPPVESTPKIAQPASVEPSPNTRETLSSRPATAPSIVVVNTSASATPQAVGAAAAPVAVTDEAINNAILHGAEFLMSRFENGKLKAITDDTRLGADALCVLALLHAGQAISDERLNVHNPFLSSALDTLRGMEMPPSLHTYQRSLRAQALAVYNRKEDRAVLESDAHWLIASSVKGAYGYLAPPTGATQPDAVSWDNSNSQYGALGVWAAAEAGVTVPLTYWQDVQTHWESCQAKSTGGWDYHNGERGTLSMTSAGVNMLFVANEMISALRPESQVARPPFSPALQAGLDWLGSGDNAVTLTNGGFSAYTLYGMERAGLACGFKMFGTHDWYRELASKVLKEQGQNGAWNNEIDTAFTMLFLARGRHPLLMNKVRFIGAWANRPRDVAHLAKFTGKETERPLNWQVVSSTNSWTDWMDAPILYLASHEAPIFDDSDYEKLKSFVHAGGLLLTNADGDSKEFNQFAELLAMKIFDGEELKDLPADHFIYNALYKPTGIPLKAVSNGTRVMMVHSPTDLARRWQTKDARTDRPAFELGANLFIYATGMAVPRNRLETLAVGDVAGAPSTTIPIARLKYAGNWDPEPWAWQRMAKLFRRETNAALDVKPIEIEKLTTDVAPIAHLTGVATFSLNDAQMAALKKYVDDGGVLLIDPCGGAPAVAQSIHENILARAFPGKEAAILPAIHLLVTGASPGMANLVKPQARPYVFKMMGQRFTRPMLIESGRGAVLVSDLDLTSGLLGTSTLGIIGYEPGYASKFVQNVILWTLNSRGGAPVWATTHPATRQ